MSYIEKGQEDQTFCSVLDGTRFLCEACAEKIHKNYQKQIEILNEVRAHSRAAFSIAFVELAQAIAKVEDPELKKEFLNVQHRLGFTFPMDEIKESEES